MRRISVWALLAMTWSLEAAQVSGVVVDPQGSAVPRAWLELLSAGGAVAQTARSDERGAFRFDNVAQGAYELAAWAPGFEKARQALRVGPPSSAIELQVQLPLAAVTETVTVTPAPGLVERILETPQQVNVVSSAALVERRATVLPQLFREEAGLHVQQTTAHQGAVFVRGLTGQQVITLIDGVRFNNATFRAGPNQYQALIDPSVLERVEVARGPSSVQYGSDSLGGAVNIITQRQSLTDGGLRAGGAVSTFFASADRSLGGDVMASLGGSRLGITMVGFGRRVHDLRPGGGRDSHAAVTRFLGLPSSVLGGRLQDTGFTDFGGAARLAAKLGASHHLSFYYTRGQQEGGSRYDQLNGGNGNLRNGFDPQVLDFFYTRYERHGWGWLDSLSATASFNRIRDDRQVQSGDPASPITFDFARTDSRGYQVQATTHVGSRQVAAWGAELFDESVRARLHRLNPVTGVATGLQRPRFPNGASYRTYATYLQDTVYLLPGRWRMTGGLRYSMFQFQARAGDNPVDPTGRPTVPDSSLRTDDVTYHIGSSYFLLPSLSVNAIVSRGFRAPNITDLSQIGLTSNGFEVSVDEATRLGGRVGSTADSTARPLGERINSLRPESLFNYEVGLKLSRQRVTSEFSYFVSDVRDFITKRSLILPPGAVGQQIGGEPIVFQDPVSGWVRVPMDSRPVVTRANAAEIRIAGVEVSQRFELSSDWSLRGNFFYFRGRDKNPSPLAPAAPGVVTIRKALDAPDIEGGIPPATGYISARYHPRTRWWIEAASNLAWRQDRLSSIELADQRVGATRTRGGISTFFNNGARARGLVSNGVLLPTGETLQQVQDRVLGRGVTSAPWFLSTPGYAILHLRAGIHLTERSTLGILIENLLDKNYRTHGSGIDGPGAGFQVRYVVRF